MKKASRHFVDALQRATTVWMNAERDIHNAQWHGSYLNVVEAGRTQEEAQARMVELMKTLLCQLEEQPIGEHETTS